MGNLIEGIVRFALAIAGVVYWSRSSKNSPSQSPTPPADPVANTVIDEADKNQAAQQSQEVEARQVALAKQEANKKREADAKMAEAKMAEKAQKEADRQTALAAKAAQEAEIKHQKTQASSFVLPLKIAKSSGATAPAPINKQGANKNWVTPSKRETLPTFAHYIKSAPDNIAIKPITGETALMIEAALKEMNFTIRKNDTWDAKPATRCIDVLKTDNTVAFHIYNDKVATNTEDLETFKAMIQSYTKAHPGREMQINTTEGLKETWKQACVEAGIDNAIIKTPQSQETLVEKTPVARPT